MVKTINIGIATQGIRAEYSTEISSIPIPSLNIAIIVDQKDVKSSLSVPRNAINIPAEKETRMKRITKPNRKRSQISTRLISSVKKLKYFMGERKKTFSHHPQISARIKGILS